MSQILFEKGGQRIRIPLLDAHGLDFLLSFIVQLKNGIGTTRVLNAERWKPGWAITFDERRDLGKAP